MDDQSSSQNKKLRDEAALITFIDEMLKDRHDMVIPEDRFPAVRTALMRQINEAINTRLVSLLNADQQNELSGLLDRDATDEEIDGFFDRSIENEENHIAAVLLEFREMFLKAPIPADLQRVDNFRPTSTAPDASFADNPPPAPVAPADLDSPDQALN
jgi:hypothetical protein